MTEHIKITWDDIEGNVSSREESTNLENIDSRHPLERIEVKDYIEKNFPEFAERFKSATKPRISSNPNLLEEWESARIIKGRDTRYLQSDTPLRNLVRGLYAESFSVSQSFTASDLSHEDKDESLNPMNKRQLNGSQGITLGGLVSHYTKPYEKAEDFPEIPKEARDINEALDLLRKKDTPWMELQEFVKRIVEIYHRREGIRQGFERRMRDTTIRRVLEGDTYDNYIEIVGFRLLALFANNPSMLENVTDEALLTTYGYRPEAKISCAGMFARAWEHAASLNTFLESGNEELSDLEKDGLNKLLFLRTHPEMQIFYKFFSPSGGINEPEQSKT